MSYSKRIPIYERNGWTLESYGNGAAYLLRNALPDGTSESCFFQGDDAAEFRARFDAYQNPENLFSDYLDVMQPDESAV